MPESPPSLRGPMALLLAMLQAAQACTETGRLAGLHGTQNKVGAGWSRNLGRLSPESANALVQIDAACIRLVGLRVGVRARPALPWLVPPLPGLDLLPNLPSPCPKTSPPHSQVAFPPPSVPTCANPPAPTPCANPDPLHQPALAGMNSPCPGLIWHRNNAHPCTSTPNLSGVTNMPYEPSTLLVMHSGWHHSPLPSFLPAAGLCYLDAIEQFVEQLWGNCTDCAAVNHRWLQTRASLKSQEG